MKDCRICRKSVDRVKNLDLYAFGSEGVNVCQQCELSLVEFIRALGHACLRAHLQGYRAAKEVAQAKLTPNPKAER